MTLPVLSLHVPWAPLVLPLAPGEDPVKKIETRNWPAPKSLIGQRLGIASTKTKPEVGDVVGAWTVTRGMGGWNMRDRPPMEAARAKSYVPLPLGHLLGTVKVVDCVPIVDVLTGEGPEDHDNSQVAVYVLPDALELVDRWVHMDDPTHTKNITDQAPYGDFTPGRWAWIFADAKRTDEMCPGCFGDGEADEPVMTEDGDVSPVTCLTCNGKGTCDPVPVTGRQKIWRWTP